MFWELRDRIVNVYDESPRTAERALRRARVIRSVMLGAPISLAPLLVNAEVSLWAEASLLAVFMCCSLYFAMSHGVTHLNDIRIAPDTSDMFRPHTFAVEGSVTEGDIQNFMSDPERRQRLVLELSGVSRAQGFVSKRGGCEFVVRGGSYVVSRAQR